MTRDEICTCAQYSQCPVCNKSRSNYAVLMDENELLVSVLADCRDRYGPNTPHGLRIRETLYRATGDESYLMGLPRWAREVARGEQPAKEVKERDAYPRFYQSCGGQTGPEEEQ